MPCPPFTCQQASALGLREPALREVHFRRRRAARAFDIEVPLLCRACNSVADPWSMQPYAGHVVLQAGPGWPADLEDFCMLLYEQLREPAVTPWPPSALIGCGSTKGSAQGGG